MKHAELKFDIFSGKIREGAIWIEAVSGLACARGRMEQIAAEVPGPYFLYCSATQSVVGQVDQSPALPSKSKSKGQSGSA